MKSVINKFLYIKNFCVVNYLFVCVQVNYSSSYAKAAGA